VGAPLGSHVRGRVDRPPHPWRLRSDFGQLCVAILLDEYGGPVGEQSALNLVYLLGFYDSSPSGEYTSVNFQGFMEGALRSGYRCAREIASLDTRPRVRLCTLRCPMPN
jgi:hypothetical protein